MCVWSASLSSPGGGGEGRGWVIVAVMISLVSSNGCCYDLLTKFTHGEYGLSSIES